MGEFLMEDPWILKMLDNCRVELGHVAPTELTEYVTELGVVNMAEDSLLEIAVQLGLKANARMSKADIAQAIYAALACAGEPTPPDLTPESPVV